MPISKLQSPTGIRLCYSVFNSLLSLLCFLPGCSTDDGAVRTDPTRSLPVRSSNYMAAVADNRWVLIPIEADPNAWSSGDSASSSIYRSSISLDIAVIDLETERRCRVFGRQVVIGNWLASFAHDEEYNRHYGYLYLPPETSRPLRFKNCLVIPATTDDSNNDGKLNHLDARSVYIFDLESLQLRRVSPEGWDLEAMRFTSEKIVLILKPWSGGHVAVFDYVPASGQGRFVAQNMDPATTTQPTNQ